VLGNLVPYDVWVPRANAPGLSRDDHTLAYLIGHVKPDVTLDAARAEMNVIGASLDPARPEIGLGVEPLADALFSGPPAFFVAAAVLLLVSGLVFLIAIANLTNLFLTGVLNRRHELTVRRMLGAEHGRLARLLAVEATLLVLGGWALGLGLARLAGSALAYLPLPERGGIVPAFDASPDWRVFCFAFVTALVVATTIAVSRHMFAAARPFTRSSRTSVGHPVQWPRQRPRAYPAVVTSPLAVSRSRTRPRSMICEARSSRPRRRSSRRSGCAFSPGVISWRVMQALPPASFSSTNELPARWV
jgi:hypothetical protein